MNRLRANPRLLAPLLGCLAMLPPLAIDTFFPAFHVMEAEFDVTPAAMQQSLSVYLFGYGAMSLLHGPLSDAYGRRGVILIALIVFLAGTIGCALAPSLPVLLFFRVCQGLAGGAGSIVGRAVIRDRFEGADATRLMAQMTLVFSVAPALAPIFGGWVLSWGSWRMIFWLIVGFTLLMVLATLIALPETHPRERRIEFSPGQLFRSYRQIIGDVRYLLLALILSLNFAGIFIYIASAPVFVLDILHLSERQFGWLFVPVISGMMLGAQTAARLAGRALPSRTIQLGFVAIGTGVVVNLLVSAWMTPAVPWSVLPVAFSAIGVTLSQPTITLKMLDRFPVIRGTAASLQMAVTLTGSTLVSGVLSPLVSHAPLTMAASAAMMWATSFGLLMIYQRLTHS
jgi:DHA1 family bicyclomycin/chloramphenicol resistance-like MFS transporter